MGSPMQCDLVPYPVPAKTSPNKKPTKNAKNSKNGSSRKGSKLKSKDSSMTSPTQNREPQKRSKRKLIPNPTEAGKNPIAVKNPEIDRDAYYDEFRCLILDPSTDKFTSESDICVACASIGDSKHFESKMIFCANCAQSYHVYCAGLKKLTMTILEKGWLCDSCDICQICDTDTKKTPAEKSVRCQECAKTYHHHCLTGIPVITTGTGPKKDENWKCLECIRQCFKLSIKFLFFFFSKELVFFANICKVVIPHCWIYI